MTDDSALRRHLPGFFLLLCLFISAGFYLLSPPDRIARTLFFPGTTETSLSGERRLIQRTVSRERAIELLVEDLLLGPARISHSRSLPRRTQLSSLILEGSTVYLDVTTASMIETSEVHVDVATGLEAIRRTVLYNFRTVDEVVITIGGQVPFAPAYRSLGP